MIKQARLDRLLANLTKPVPSPAKPRAKIQKSFSTLHLGQHVENLNPVYIGVKKLDPQPWEVIEVNSLGAKVKVVGGEETFTLKKEWKQLFKRVRKPTKRK